MSVSEPWVKVLTEYPEIDYYRHLDPEEKKRVRLILLEQLEQMIRRTSSGTYLRRCVAMTGNHSTANCLGCLMADLATLDPQRNIPDSWMAL